MILFCNKTDYVCYYVQFEGAKIIGGTTFRVIYNLPGVGLYNEVVFSFFDRSHHHRSDGDIYRQPSDVKRDLTAVIEKGQRTNVQWII